MHLKNLRINVYYNTNSKEHFTYTPNGFLDKITTEFESDSTKFIYSDKEPLVTMLEYSKGNQLHKQTFFDIGVNGFASRAEEFYYLSQR